MSSKARISVLSAVPAASAAAQLAASEISYILLVPRATLDITGKYKYLLETVAVSELAQKLVAKTFANSAATNDVTTRSVQLGKNDTVSTTELFVATLVFIRSFLDAALVSDKKALGANKNIFDSIALSDRANAVTAKFFSEIVTTDDALAATDGLLYAFAKHISDTVLPQDSVLLYSRKAFADMISTSDTGVVSWQTYCSTTYFATDYVGESRLF